MALICGDNNTISPGPEGRRKKRAGSSSRHFHRFAFNFQGRRLFSAPLHLDNITPPGRPLNCTGPAAAASGISPLPQRTAVVQAVRAGISLQPPSSTTYSGMELLRVALWNHGMEASLTILNLMLEYARLHQQPRQHRTPSEQRTPHLLPIVGLLHRTLTHIAFPEKSMSTHPMRPFIPPMRCPELSPFELFCAVYLSHHRSVGQSTSLDAFDCCADRPKSGWQPCRVGHP